MIIKMISAFIVDNQNPKGPDEAVCGFFNAERLRFKLLEHDDMDDTAPISAEQLFQMYKDLKTLDIETLKSLKNVT